MSKTLYLVFQPCPMCRGGFKVIVADTPDEAIAIANPPKPVVRPLRPLTPEEEAKGVYGVDVEEYISPEELDKEVAQARAEGEKQMREEED